VARPPVAKALTDSVAAAPVGCDPRAAAPPGTRPPPPRGPARCGARAPGGAWGAPAGAARGPRGVAAGRRHRHEANGITG